MDQKTGKKNASNGDYFINLAQIQVTFYFAPRSLFAVIQLEVWLSLSPPRGGKFKKAFESITGCGHIILGIWMGSGTVNKKLLDADIYYSVPLASWPRVFKLGS